MPIRRIDHRALDVAELTAAKNGRTTSVCLPARNEAETVGEIVDRIAAHPLVDEVVVVDDHSSDGTGDAATAAGATVVRAAEVLPEHGEGPGKGQALWKAVASSTGDVVAFCDADLRDFQPHFITGLLGPFLLDPGLAELGQLEVSDGRPSETALVLGSFRRRSNGDWDFVLGGRGYPGGLEELIQDFGIEVE